MIYVAHHALKLRPSWFREDVVTSMTMGLPQEDGVHNMDETQVTIPYPAPTKQVAGEVNGVKTDVMLVSFSDKIIITITQNGRLAQWVWLFAIHLIRCIY